MRYEQGKGVTQVHVHALFFCLSVLPGAGAARMPVSVETRLKGKGVRQDGGKAVKFFRQAAREQHAESLYALGHIYFQVCVCVL